MASTTFSQKIFQPKPPIQGSFPLDHDGECKKEMLEYMLCIKKEKSEHTRCRELAKDYLHCRMNKDLMEKRDLETFGYKASKDSSESEPSVKK